MFYLNDTIILCCWCLGRKIFRKSVMHWAILPYLYTLFLLLKRLPASSSCFSISSVLMSVVFTAWQHQCRACGAMFSFLWLLINKCLPGSWDFYSVMGNKVVQHEPFRDLKVEGRRYFLPLAALLMCWPGNCHTTHILVVERTGTELPWVNVLLNSNTGY